MTTITDNRKDSSTYTEIIGLWWNAEIRDWHLPPNNKLEIEFYISSRKRPLSLDEFAKFIEANNKVIITTGLHVLLSTLIWTKHPIKNILVDQLRNSRIIPVDILEEAVSARYKELWPIQQVLATVVETPLPEVERARETKKMFELLNNLSAIKAELLDRGIYFNGMYYDLVRSVAAILCGWQGIAVDVPLLKEWASDFNEDIEKNPSILDDRKVAGRYRSITDLYESVLPDGTVHPSYTSDPFGRTYTLAPNIQVLEHGGERSPRSLLIARKGKSLYYSDASTANLHPLAEIWRSEYGSETLADDINNPFDIHFRTGLYILHPSKFSAVKSMTEAGRSWRQAAKEAEITNLDAIRGLGKDINFAIPNGASLSTMKMNAKSRGFELTDKAYTRFRKQYSKRYPIDQWLSDGQGIAEARTLTGRVHITDRQPQWSSFRIQATIADLFSDGIFMAAVEDSMFPSMWVHDSVIYEAANINKAETAVQHFQHLAEEWFPKTNMRFTIEDLGRRLESFD